MSTVPSYIPIPPSATPIPPASGATTTRAKPPKSEPTTAAALPSFPPVPTTTAAAAPRKYTLPTTSLSTNVSDLLLSSLLPANLPKLPTAKGQGGPGRPRELNSQREGLRLEIMSHNFRRFITRAGPVFWLQDRVEEVLFWRKPIWTWAWMMAWTFISFQPRILLLLPSLILMIIILHLSELRNPLPSLLGVSTSAPSASTLRTTGTKVDPDGGPVSITTGVDGEALPVVPPKEAESGVDYYMNLQAIQNTMGWVSDAYDDVHGLIVTTLTPSKSPTTLPLTATHLLLLLLPPSLLLPLIPTYLIPYLLLPIGWGPPLSFHPNIATVLAYLPSSAPIRRAQALLTRLMLTDSLSDQIGRATIAEVEVWENERLDPVISTAKPVAGGIVPVGSWNQRFLRAGERLPWVKIKGEDSIWAEEGGAGAQASEAEKSKAEAELKDGWNWIPGEEWRVDVSGLWSDVGVDADGWVYSDDSWQNLAPTSLPNVDPDSPVPAMRRVTRRRKWWRRVYVAQEAA